MLTDTPKETENKAILNHLYEELWSKRNLSILDEVYSPEVLYHTPSMELHNLDELKNLFNDYSLAFHDSNVTVKDQIAKDDIVVTKFIYEGVYKGKSGALSPTGNKIKIEGVIIDRLANGKIVDEYFRFVN
jgi:predicted ester cyclase